MISRPYCVASTAAPWGQSAAFMERSYTSTTRLIRPRKFPMAGLFYLQTYYEVDAAASTHRRGPTIRDAQKLVRSEYEIAGGR